MNKEINNQRDQKIKRIREERARKKARSSSKSASRKSSVVKKRPAAPAGGAKKKKLTYHPMDLKMMEGKEFSLTYNPLNIRAEKEDDERKLSLLSRGMGSKMESRKIEAEMRIMRQRKEREIQRMEDNLPSYQKHLPRKLPQMIRNLDNSIQNRISKRIKLTCSGYKDRVDRVRVQNRQRIEQHNKKKIVRGLAKLKGIDLEQVVVRRKSNGNGQRSKSRGSVNLNDLRKRKAMRSRSRGGEKRPQKKKAVRPEDNPDFIYCFRCSEHHHKDKHQLAPTGYNSRQIPSRPRIALQASSLIPKKANNTYNPLGSSPASFKNQRKRSMLGKRPQPSYNIEEDRESYSDQDEYEQDFIDDTPVENTPAYLKELRKLTGYNPSKYRHLDIMDDRNMEVRNYEDLEREDRRTARLARLEDKREEEILKKVEEMRRRDRMRRGM